VGVVAFVLATTNLWQARKPTQEVAADASKASATTPVESPLPVSAVSAAAGAPAPTVADSPVSIAPEPQPQPRPTLAALASNPEFALDRERAIGTLLSLWGGRYDRAGGEACAQAARQGLQCLSQQRGTLGELRRLNWPALLTLVDERGGPHDVVVMSLHSSSADVTANGKTFEVPLTELSYYWYGDHVLLWRPAISPPRDLTPGMDDSGVLWLRESLARIRGEDLPTAASTVYDSTLETRVREYQREHMLTIDGIVGARTQIALIADLKIPGTPVLAAGR
jgi:general secretion pathway protein A